METADPNFPLCRQLGCPHKGWKWLDVIDSREDEGLTFEEYENCQFCGQESIRFVHLIKHANWKDVIRVGCVCAVRMTDDYSNPEERERKLRAHAQSRATRRGRFVNHRSWKISSKGNEWIEYEGFLIVVLKQRGGFKLCIDKKFGSIVYDSEQAAKLGAFDYVWKKLHSNKSK